MICKKIRYLLTKPELLYHDKYAYTVILLLTHLIYATSYSTFGPTFVDLEFTLNTSTQMIALFPTVFSIGNTLGTLFGLVFKFLNRQMTLICLLILMAISSTLVPFTRLIWQFYACAFFMGIGAGAWITAYNVWLMEMWQRKSGQVLFLSQLMYGIGSVLGPLIDRPYVTGDVSPDDNLDAMATFNTHNITDAEVERRRSLLTIPFLITGGLQIIFPTVLVIMFFARKYTNQMKTIETDNDMKNVKLFDRTDSRRRLLLIVLIAVCLSAINSLELIYFNFLSTYLQKMPLHIKADRAAEISATLGTAYTVGQAVNFFIAMFIKAKHMIGYHLVITVLSIVGLFFVQNSETGLWILSISVGFGFSLLYPGILGYTGQYLEYTNRIGTIMWFSCGAVQFIPPIILGHFLESDPNVFIITQIIHMFITFLSFISLLVLIKKTQNLDKCLN